MKIKLHIGAHKTATTHIQALLEHNEAYLEKQGVRIVTPKSLRVRWLNDLIALSDLHAAIDDDFLRRMAPSTGIWLVSEENISGIPYDFMVSTGLYPNLPHRLKLLKRLFGDVDIEIFFSVRRYDAFYRSLYLEVVRNRGYIPFERFYQEEKFAAYSWKELLDSVTQVIPESNITLWCYEDISKVLPTVMEKMTGFACYERLIGSYPQKKTRTSLSQKALRILASEDSDTVDDAREEKIAHLLRKYPVGDRYPPFEPFDSRQQSIYQDKYDDDIKAIKRSYPRLDFIHASSDSIS